MITDIGADIKRQKPEDISEDMMRNSTKIVNMGCMDKSFCPNLIDCATEDPKGKPIEK